MFQLAASKHKTFYLSEIILKGIPIKKPFTERRPFYEWKNFSEGLLQGGLKERRSYKWYYGEECTSSFSRSEISLHVFL